jgi:acetolactate decarboxylase
MKAKRIDKARMGVRLATALFCAMSVSSCATSGAPRDTLYQVSLAHALLAKDSVGEVTLEKLLQHGNFGIGTSDRPHHAMIVLSGKVYQAKKDGTVERPLPTETTPWAAVVRFRTDSQLSIDHRMTIEELEARIDAGLDNFNIFYALRLETRIPSVTIRAVEAASTSDRGSARIDEEPESWTHTDIKGALVGLRFPSYVGSMSGIGYHWHFVSADRELGGHVVAAELDRGAVDIDHIRTWEVVLPEGDEFGTLNLVAPDPETVEQQPESMP